MRLKSFFWLMAGVLMLSACTDEETMVNEVEEGIIRLDVRHPSQQTRLTDTAFENYDSIGLYVTTTDEPLKVGGNEVNNECYVYAGTAWTPLRKVYWNQGKYNVYAYYPYSKGIANVDDYTFAVATDQSLTTPEAGMTPYEASDFLWASAMDVEGSSNPVKLQFSHRMSNAYVKIEKGEDYDGSLPSDMEVYIHSTVADALIDLSTGDVVKNDYASEKTIKARKLSNTEFVACVVPQRIDTRRPLVEVVTKGISYLMEGRISYKQGVRHTLIVTISKSLEQTKIEIGGNVGGWN